MSEPCLTGASLADMTMCSVLNAASKETLPQNVRPEPQRVEVTALPTNLQQAITECDGTTSCKLIGYNFEKNTAENVSSVDYVVDTYNTTGDTSLVLVKKDELVPQTGQYTYSSLPTLFVNPPGYEVLPMVAIGGSMYSQLNVDQVGCASQCDSNVSCKGFNSTKALDFFHDPVCELYTNADTQVPSDGVKVAFVKETISSIPSKNTLELRIKNIDMNSFNISNVKNAFGQDSDLTVTSFTMSISFYIKFSSTPKPDSEIQRKLIDTVRTYVLSIIPSSSDYLFITTESVYDDPPRKVVPLIIRLKDMKVLKNLYDNLFRINSYGSLDMYVDIRNLYNGYWVNGYFLPNMTNEIEMLSTGLNKAAIDVWLNISGYVAFDNLNVGPNNSISRLLSDYGITNNGADVISYNSESFKNNQASFCKDPLACNKEITRLINSGTVQKFSTNDLDACALCPNRLFTRDGFTVTDEFGSSTRTGSSIAAINQIMFQNFDISGCSSNFRLADGTCVNTCPPESPYSSPIPGTLHYLCITSCPSEQPYYDKNTRVCAKSCKELNSTYFANGFECVNACPVDKVYMNDGVCSTACPADKYIVRSQTRPEILCVTACPADTPYLNGSECLATCPNDKFYDRNVCVTSCPTGITPNPSTRICRSAACSSDLPFKNGSVCVASCPVFSAGDVCVDSCPPALPYKNGNACVSACPNNTISDNYNCVSSCPATRPVIDYFGMACVSSCPAGQIGDLTPGSLSGVYKCRTGTTCSGVNPVNNHGICMQACTLPEFIDFASDGTKFCTNSCPSDRPYRAPGTSLGCLYACGLAYNSPPYVDIDGVTCTNTCSGTSALDPKIARCVAQCPANTVSTNRICTNCPAGQGSTSGGLCTNCPAGQSSTSGGACNPCPAGQSSTSGGLCTNCPAGQSSTSGGSCTPCSTNETSTPGSLCAPCPAGKTIKGVVCQSCPAGQSSTIGGLCEPCPAGQSSSVGGLCTNCPNNQFSTSGGACISCPANESSTSGAIKCTPCPPSQQSVSGGSCVDCGYTWASVSGYSCVSVCPGGFNKFTTNPNDPNRSPARCFPATCSLVQYNGFSFSCVTDCSPGSYAGFYNVCVKCPIGHYTRLGSSGRNECVQCPAGTYSGGEYKSSCTPCPAGTFSITGANYCTACPAGTTFAGSNATSPSVCK